MEFDKSESLKECKRLLRLINCEAIIDTKDQTLYDMLFKSEVKKKMLLSWLMQQLYSFESCASNTFEDLVSVFIPKQYLSKFLSGNLPYTEQYQRWRLIMLTLYRRQKGNNFDKKTDVTSEIQNGNTLDKYEKLWNEKPGLNFNYIGLVTAKQKKLDATELKLELEKAKTKLSEFTSVIEPKNLVNNGNSQLSLVFERFKNCNDQLTEIISKKYVPWILSANNTSQEDCGLKYSYLNQVPVNEIQTNLLTLYKNIGMFDRLTSGVENLQPLRDTSDALYQNK